MLPILFVLFRAYAQRKLKQHVESISTRAEASINVHDAHCPICHASLPNTQDIFDIKYKAHCGLQAAELIEKRPQVTYPLKRLVKQTARKVDASRCLACRVEVVQGRDETVGEWKERREDVKWMGVCGEAVVGMARILGGGKKGKKGKKA
ncbi:hypothetical protein P154DRAFT_533968 [Amniculicola lignicola CBS 123094]|uniref:Uncharacterized protein n=1 Tax=Amniculicola lignicola CBS 123094 TaxID=1392246 RepID=A0A6A5WID5_9PLEO|nr:hypothetical protein P154DRAFT_533968 [Amniculicola lignicola CBS 123094]